jgi:hypothetical protein
MPPASCAAVILSLGVCIALSGCTGTSSSVDVPTSLTTSVSASVVSTPPATAAVPPSSMAPSSEPSATPAEASATPTEPAQVRADAVISRIGDRQWARIEATGTWRAECPAGRDDLRRLEVNYVDFDGGIQRGSLVANRDTVDDLAAIFTDLFDAKFPIARMEPVEKYDGDVIRSLKANNTSAFNCRRPDQINAPTKDSPHANGRAVDINPYQNPWTDPRCDCWVPSADFADNREGPGVITKGSLPWQLFTERGWIWQDIKVPDYMHFDTGFPSRPRRQ